MCFKLWISDNKFLQVTPTFNMYNVTVDFVVDHFKLFSSNEGTKKTFT